MSGLVVGLRGEARLVVAEGDTASRYGSGLVAAFATPALVALMEKASVAAIHDYLEPGETSVGIQVDVKHLAPTPVGMNVVAKAELIEVDGHRLRFKIDAWDALEKIGEGVHFRARINRTHFNERLTKKSGTIC